MLGCAGVVVLFGSRGILSFMLTAFVNCEQVLLLKSYLQSKGLKDVYTGGLGSFSLTIMLVFYLEVSRQYRAAVKM